MRAPAIPFEHKHTTRGHNAVPLFQVLVIQVSIWLLSVGSLSCLICAKVKLHVLLLVVLCIAIIIGLVRRKLTDGFFMLNAGVLYRFLTLRVVPRGCVALGVDLLKDGVSSPNKSSRNSARLKLTGSDKNKVAATADFTSNALKQGCRQTRMHRLQ